MSLRALRRHCHLPTAAALISVLLYTALISSHIVSQATSLAAPAQSIATGDPGCHETQPSAGKAKNSNHGLPASPAKKCPFCAGYATLHLSVFGDFVGNLLCKGAETDFAGLGDGHLIEPATSHSWHPRAPPTLG
jgi:hypothetical protein